LAENDAAAGSIRLMPELIVDSGQVEIHLSGVLGLEVLDLEVDYDKTAQPKMKKSRSS
jgi:hypothetical protein